MKKYIPRDIYISYIQSDKWRRKKAVIIKRDGCKCAICNRKDKPLHVHHLTYERFDHENDDDLITLCKECHDEIHALCDDADLARRRREEWVEDYEDWNFFPHMRRAPHNLPAIAVATFRQIALPHYSNGDIKDDVVSDATGFLCDNNKTHYIKCNSSSEEEYILQKLAIKDAQSLVKYKAKRDAENLEFPIYIAVYYDEFWLSNYRNAKYEDVVSASEIIENETATLQIKILDSRMSNEALLNLISNYLKEIENIQDRIKEKERIVKILNENISIV